MKFPLPFLLTSSEIEMNLKKKKKKKDPKLCFKIGLCNLCNVYNK